MSTTAPTPATDEYKPVDLDRLKETVDELEEYELPYSASMVSEAADEITYLRARVENREKFLEISDAEHKQQSDALDESQKAVAELCALLGQWVKLWTRYRLGTRGCDPMANEENEFIKQLATEALAKYGERKEAG